MTAAVVALIAALLSPPAETATDARPLPVKPVSDPAQPHLRADGALVVGDRVVDTAALPPLVARLDGALYYARSERAAETDVWRWTPEKGPERLTFDGRSDRPYPLRDGGVVWVSSRDGRAVWVRDGAVIARWPSVPVPARPEATRTVWDAALRREVVVFDAGEALWALDATTGRARRWR